MSGRRFGPSNWAASKFLAMQLTVARSLSPLPLSPLRRGRWSPWARQQADPAYDASVTGRAIPNVSVTLSAKPSSRRPVPRHLRREVATVLITRDQLARRIRALAREVQHDYAGCELVIVSLLNGTVLFLADLIRHLALPLRLDFMGVSSYGSGTESGELVFTKELRLDVRGRDVLLVDDILDTGRTIKRVLEKLHHLKPRRIRTCVLLDKPARRVEKVKANYIGFQIPDLFVVGYGLDYAERYRNLPFVGVLRPEMYRSASA